MQREDAIFFGFYSRHVDTTVTPWFAIGLESDDVTLVLKLGLSTGTPDKMVVQYRLYDSLDLTRPK